MRTDLTREQQLVQAVHAAHEAGMKYCPNRTLSVVVCEAKGPEHLECITSDLDAKNISHVVFHEPDMGDVATSIATEPVGDQERRLLKRYRLWKGA